MVPAVTRVSASLDLSNITIYYPADEHSATALAYRNEDLARQQRDPSYKAPCYETANPRLPSAKVDDDELVKGLKRKLCDFLGYSEHDDPNKRQHLVAPQGQVFAPSVNRHPEHRASVQGTQGPSRHHNSELTAGFADHARFIANQNANRLPQTLNNDRYRNNTSPHLAPPNPAMVTRQLPSSPAYNTPQGYGQRPNGSYASQPVSRHPTPNRPQQPVPNAQYDAATRVAMDVRQLDWAAQQEHLLRQQQQQARSGSSPVAQYRGVSPRMGTPGMMPTSTSYSPQTSQRVPTTTAPQQQQQRSPSSISNAPVRPASTSPLRASPRMAQSPPSGSAWSPQRLPAMFTAQSKSPRTTGVRHDSPQMTPTRINNPQGTWLGSATSQAMQPHVWAKRPISPSRPRVGDAQPAHLSADRQFYLSESIDARFMQPAVPTEPARTVEQHRSAWQEVQAKERQNEQDNATRKMKDDLASFLKNAEGNHRPTGPPATARQDKYAGRTSGATLAALYDLEIPAAATHSLMRTPVDSQPRRESSSHYTATQLQQQMNPMGAILSGPFRDAALNRVFPPAPDGRGGEIQVPIDHSEDKIMRLLHGHPPLLRKLQGMDPQSRRRYLQQWCQTYEGYIRQWLLAHPPANSPQPQQQQPLPPYQQQQNGREAPAQPSGSTLDGRYNVQRTNVTGAQLASPPSGETSQSVRLSTAPPSRPAPYSVGGKVGHPVPLEIQRIVADIKGVQKTNSGFPVKKMLKDLEEGYFAKNGTLLKGGSSKGKNLLEWFGDERLFTADEWHYLRYTGARNASPEHT